jgi:asparagine synthase (glutamine-hydrolysing)
MRKHTESWFAVLPDLEPALGIAERLRGETLLRHGSGRPWIVGDGVRAVPTENRELTVVAIGNVSDAWRSGASRAHRLEELDGGSFHLVATDGRRVRVQGAAFDTRRIFHTRVDGITVATDRVRVAARLAGARLDDERLALRLAAASTYALADGTLWHGVHAVRGGSALYIDGAGLPVVRRWWRPPQADLPLEDGAGLLRDALRESVRRQASGVMAADLSGGLDSTSICFLARESGTQLVTATLKWSAAGNEDADWAERAAAELSPVKRFIYEPGALPAYFTGLAEPGEPLDEPTNMVRNIAELRAMSADLAFAGATARLSGHGGDHLTRPEPAFLPELFRRSPVLAMRHAAAFRARARWSASETRRMLLDRRDYGAWLRDAVSRPAPLGWEPAPMPPPWASEKARAIVADLYATAAKDAEPLAESRGQHARIHAALEAGLHAHQLAQRSARAGLPATAPFCDDAVVDACLRVRAEDVRTPTTYKPLLVAAMRGIVPDHLLTRTTKDHSTLEWHDGLRRNAGDLAALTVDSHLVERGLVDPDAFRDALLSPDLLRTSPLVVETTLGLEIWLRHEAGT